MFQGNDLTKYSERQMQQVRGSEIAMIFQDPMTSLNPTMKVGKQIEEVFVGRKGMTRAEVRERALEILRLVGINEPERRYKQYPHELSGGMKQRVMIAIALVGNTALAVSIAFHPATYGLPLTFRGLAAHAASLHPVWLKVAFAFILVGYGTKMGLAPMHTWLPDAHSEAPSPVSALLSGALLNCAFLGILRTNAILVRAGIGDYSNGLLIAFGLGSMFLAGWFILQQADFKRLLAYSSIEHMGILAIAAGAGASFGGLLHALNLSLTKGALFLVAGTILGAYHTKSTRTVTGVIRVAPMTGLLWLAGFLAICGVPPFGTFVSEFSVMTALGANGRWWSLAIFLLTLGIVFVGMWRIVIPMAFGCPPESHPSGAPVRFLSVADVPPLALLCVVLLLGVWLPEPLTRLVTQAAAVMGGL